LSTSRDAHLRNISEISLQGIIKSDDTTDSDVVLGNLGHNSSLHGINLTAKQLGVLTVGNVITNTQINARFNVNLEDIRDYATIGNIKSGNTVIIAKTLAKEDQEKIKKALLAKSTTDNPHIFSDKKSKIRGLFLKENPNVGFVETNTAWYEGMKDIK